MKVYERIALYGAWVIIWAIILVASTMDDRMATRLDALEAENKNLVHSIRTVWHVVQADRGLNELDWFSPIPDPDTLPAVERDSIMPHDHLKILKEVMPSDK